MKSNILMHLTNKYKNRKWNWTFISKNPNITMEIIEEYPNKPWDWYNGVSANENITIEFVEKHKNKDWNWTFLSHHVYVDEAIILKYLFNWDYNELSKNKHVTLDLVMANKSLLWNRISLMENPNMTIEFYKTHPKMFNYIFSDTLSKNPTFSLKDLINGYVYWFWEIVFRYNHNVTFDFYRQYLAGRGISVKYLSNNPNITLDIIENNPTLDWDWKLISCNPNITIGFIQKNIDKFNLFDWYEISRNKGITMKDISEYISFPWKYEGVSENPNITIPFIEEHSGLTDDKGRKYDLISFDKLSRNTFTLFNKVKSRILRRKKKRIQKKISKDIIWKSQEANF